MPAMTAERARPILVVDDDQKIVRLVRTYLERERYRVIEANDGAAALAAVETHDPALVIVDLMLPKIDGLAVVRAVRDRSNTPIIILSARGTTPDRIAGLGLGADDYLPKPFSPAELVLRVGRVLARTIGARGPEPQPLLEHGRLALDRERHAVTVDGRPVPVTAVEFRLLTALLEAGGRVLTRDQLLDAVYGTDASEVLDRTIDVHIGRLRDKLDDPAAAPRFIATVRGTGYRTTPISDPPTEPSTRLASRGRR
jgi:DNA-binding response OmpR family regulator